VHELTLATSLVELANSHAAQHGTRRIVRITIRLGALCGIARSLYFCFKPAARGTLCEDADLRIIEVPLRVHCDACQQIKAPRALYNFRCPDCGHPAPKVITGREMELVSIELSDTDDARGVNSALPAAEEMSARGIMGMAE
jgi:hydrogenase nickel incorporation protein HypA/HybF